MALVVFEAVRRWIPAQALEALTTALERCGSDGGRPAEKLASLFIARGVVYRDSDEHEAAAADFREARSLTEAGTLPRATLDFEEGVAHV